jgi:hypothetical protein
VASVSNVKRLKEFQTLDLFPLQEMGPGTYLLPLHIEGNSILSSVYVNALDAGASIKVNYFDTSTGSETGERYDLTSHPLITTAATSPDRKTIARIHNKPVCEVIIAGGNVTFGVMATVVSSFATDLDTALVANLQDYISSINKGIPTALLDPNDNKFYLTKGDQGAAYVKVVGGFSVSVSANTTPAINNVTATLADTEYNYAFAVGTKKFLIRSRSGTSFKFSFTATESSTNYVTCNGIYDIENLDESIAFTIYFQTKKAEEIFEILSWS